MTVGVGDLVRLQRTPQRLDGSGPLASRQQGRNRLHQPHHSEELGWTTIERVGRVRPYDLECKNTVGEILHVEVKGTHTRGEKVELTDGEVRHNRNTADCAADYHAFYEVARITVSPEGEITRSDGEEVTCILPWIIDEEHDLAP